MSVVTNSIAVDSFLAMTTEKYSNSTHGGITSHSDNSYITFLKASYNNVSMLSVKSNRIHEPFVLIVEQ